MQAFSQNPQASTQLPYACVLSLARILSPPTVVSLVSFELVSLQHHPTPMHMLLEMTPPIQHRSLWATQALSLFYECGGESLGDSLTLPDGVPTHFDHLPLNHCVDDLLNSSQSLF
jgi:hypothetical protein